MRFSHLHLENWRNFTSVDVALQQRVFLIGANATGKSNLLDVFRFLRDLVRIKGGFQEAVTDRRGVVSIRSLAAKGTPDIVIDVTIADADKDIWRYRLAFNEDDQHRPVVKEEKVWKLDQLLLNRPNERDLADKELLYQTYLEQSNSNRAFQEIAKFFDSIRYHHIVPQLVRESERSPRVVFDPHGRDFIAQMASLPKRTQTSRLQTIKNALGAAIPQLQDLRIDIDKQGIPHLQGKFEHWQNEVWQTEADFSDGTLRLIGLLWAMVENMGPLLLEEPELALQQDIVWHIPGMLAAVQRTFTRQIMLSTHSPELLRNEGIAPNEVLVHTPTPNGTKVVAGSDIDVLRHLVETGLSIAEAAMPHIRPPKAHHLSHQRGIA